MAVTFTLNGKATTVNVDPQMPRFPALLSTGMLGTEQCIEKSWVLRRSAPLRPISLPQD